jgi:hypothetical protein
MTAGSQYMQGSNSFWTNLTPHNNNYPLSNINHLELSPGPSSWQPSDHTII